MRLIFRPLEVWTDPATQYRKPSTFKASWTQTMTLLDREIDLLANGGRLHADAVIQVDAPESAMRIDGGLRASATAGHPGVIITFDSPYGPMRYACDRFNSWKDNVRAIALGLEALRKVDRYGITKRGEQYTGWKQIGSGIEMPAAQMTADDALEFLRISAEWSCGPDYDSPAQIADAYRAAAKRLHPDAGGSTELFQRLQEAKRVLGLAS